MFPFIPLKTPFLAHYQFLCDYDETVAVMYGLTCNGMRNEWSKWFIIRGRWLETQVRFITR